MLYPPPLGNSYFLETIWKSLQVVGIYDTNVMEIQAVIAICAKK